jgi:hypothetical protein
MWSIKPPPEPKPQSPPPYKNLEIEDASFEEIDPESKSERHPE